MLTYWETLTAIQSNAPVNDSYAQLWGRKSQGGYTVTTYTGTLPATLTGTKAGYLYRYKIYGNTEQTGTPTPENPIEPQECGERTENLIDDFLDQAYIDLSTQGVVTSYSSIDLALFPIEQGSTYTIQRFKSQMELYVGFFVSKPVIGSVTYDQAIHAPPPQRVATFTFVAPITGWAAVRSSRTISPKATLCAVKGSTTPKSYIPYGYKLPLTSAGQDVDIYLAESQTTRRIKKLVLDGTENWTNNGDFSFTNVNSLDFRNTVSGLLCSHAPVILRDDFNRQPSIFWGRAHPGDVCLCVSNTAMSLSDFKAYLAAQYANGTPVTVWYVLAEPETGALNEPLRKIGDYTDTIDSTQTSAQIPTTANSTTIGWAGEGLAPSKIELEYEKKR